ncbi:MAG: Tfx family DNA-binding protein [Methanothrix sp.]|jgi:Tfx family DNA-binding protein|nr:Tfx family DNA-binding protein [Methanothrix sp.]HNR58893.1 Tfx family DNA-binding protein [Methanothrix sp.]HOI69708.1 Tfx family DNA-binding protein [Methanothrix sp.]
MGEGPAAREGLLTRRQVAVLKLRRQGLSQQEVAEILGTTRSNVSILEKRALQNVFRARATLREWTMIHAPISITVPAGTDLFDLPGLVFQEADRAGIKLEIGSVDIVVQIREKAPEALRKRVVVRDLEVAVTEDGLVLVSEALPT